MEGYPVLKMKLDHALGTSFLAIPASIHYPVSGPSSGSYRPLFQWQTELSILQQGTAGQHREHLPTFRPAWDLGLSSSKFGSWSSSFILKFLLGYSFLSSLIFLFSLFQTSEGVEIRCDLPWVRRRCHVCAELPWPASTTSDSLSEPLCCQRGWSLSFLLEPSRSAEDILCYTERLQAG